MRLVADRNVHAIYFTYDEYAPAQLTERNQGTERESQAQERRALRVAATGLGNTPDPPKQTLLSLRSVSCDGCGTDLDEDGACPCCEGART